MDDLHDWIFGITLAQLRDWFPNETKYNLERLRNELYGHSARNWTLRRRRRAITKLININQGAWNVLNQQFHDGVRPTTFLQVDRQMENVPYAIAVVSSINREEIKIGYLKKQYEEEIFELLDWGRKITVKINEHRGELVDPPTVTLYLSSAATLS